MKNLQILLARRPKGWVQESDFQVIESELPPLGDNQLLVKNLYLSLDPYMRGRMDDVRSYAQKMELGQVMVGATVAEVVESRHTDFSVGDIVLGMFGWQQFGISDGTGLRKVDPKRFPLTAYLGLMGMPGATAWIGMIGIGQPKAGETVVVSAAAGAVGGTAGQIARIRGARVIGIAGGPAKCDFVTSELGFDLCLDYKKETFKEDLKAATPNRIDVYFENVGGEVGEAVYKRLNTFSRVPICGLISQYNSTESRPTLDPRIMLVNRVRMEGFIVSDRTHQWSEAFRDLGTWLQEKKIRYRETIAEGLRNAPRAFIGMLKGENFGKQLVRI